MLLAWLRRLRKKVGNNLTETTPRLYTETELKDAVKKAVADVIQTQLEEDVKEIKAELKTLNGKVLGKLVRVETAVYYIFPIIIALLAYHALA